MSERREGGREVGRGKEKEREEWRGREGGERRGEGSRQGNIKVFILSFACREMQRITLLEAAAKSAKKGMWNKEKVWCSLFGAFCV